MKNLLLKELLISSDSERAARSVSFDPKVTVIKGENSVGKSSIIKTIYQTLGAVPPNIHARWKDAKTTSLLHFSVDSVAYSMLLDGKRYTLFDESGNKLEIFKSVTDDLAPYFAKLFDFQLELQTQDGGGRQATPAFLFLPFYFDQDKSWTAPWSCFERLGQFRNGKRDAAYFHTGVRPNEYYQAKTRQRQEEAALTDIRRDKSALESVITRVDEITSHPAFDIDPVEYQKEIEGILGDLNALKVEEEAIKARLVELYSNRARVDRQIQVARHSAHELAQDLSFAATSLDDSVDCPLCGAVYENSFRERFDIAVDEDKCLTLLAECEGERLELNAEIAALHEQSKQVAEKYASISKTLERKKGDLVVRDVIQAEGRKELRTVVQGEMAEKDKLIKDRLAEIDKFKEEVKTWTDRKRKKRISGEFVTVMRRFLDALAVVDMAEKMYKGIYVASLAESGSNLSRALAAYYFAILHTIPQDSTSAFCPIIVDSPRQQDQDDPNWNRILEFIRDNQPANSQLVLGVVDDMGVDFGGKVIELKNDKYHMLLQDQYEAVALTIREYREASIE